MTLAIRPERPEDRDRSLEIERLAFGSDEEVAIVEGVRDDDGSFALVAELDGELVGHVQLSRAWVGRITVLALGPIGVVPDRQREGIGSALMRAALDEAIARREPAIILLGDPSFYSRFGFEPAANFDLRNPFAGEVADEHFMLVPLDDRGRSISGDVRWHPAFS